MLDKLTSVGIRTDSSRLNPPLQPNSADIARDDGLAFPFKDTPRRARAFPGYTIPSATLHARFNQQTEILAGDGRRPYTPVGKYADGSPLHTPAK